MALAGQRAIEEDGQCNSDYEMQTELRDFDTWAMTSASARQRYLSGQGVAIDRTLSFAPATGHRDHCMVGEIRHVCRKVNDRSAVINSASFDIFALREPCAATPQKH
jgi:hypothetical protein